MKKFYFCLAALLLPMLPSCNHIVGETVESEIEPESTLPMLTPQEVARIFARLPIGMDQIAEVRDAASGSIVNGYDEEYTMENLFGSPGCGVGGTATKSDAYSAPLRDLLSEYFSSTRASGVKAEQCLEFLSKSGLQIYWPFSENWDGREFPVVTFDPGDGAETNIAYRIEKNNQGYRIVDSVIVDEPYAAEHPVWVINSNVDSGFEPLLTYDESPVRTSSYNRRLVLHDFTMLRNYDNWLEGGSEFFVKVGAVNGFNASTEAELHLYRPSVTDFMIVVKRSEKGKAKVFDSIILTDFTNQMENLAFLITEDDGGTRTTWKCSATVKIKSKSYGFDVELPINEKDDIVWRGQLSASFFQAEDFVFGRFGDVEVTFSLQ